MVPWFSDPVNHSGTSQNDFLSKMKVYSTWSFLEESGEEKRLSFVYTLDLYYIFCGLIHDRLTPVSKDKWTSSQHSRELVKSKEVVSKVTTLYTLSMSLCCHHSNATTGFTYLYLG